MGSLKILVHVWCYPHHQDNLGVHMLLQNIIEVIMRARNPTKFVILKVTGVKGYVKRFSLTSCDVNITSTSSISPSHENQWLDWILA